MDLLRKALHSQSSTERLMYVSVFAVSGYSNTLYRESKPFNPLLGETFEWQSADGDTRFLCEQVCCKLSSQSQVVKATPKHIFPALSSFE